LVGIKTTISRLKKMLSGLKSKRVILAGDFNSMETLSTFDILAPSCAKEANAEVVQTLLSEWRFKDLWTQKDNDSRETERNLQEHLTYWNHELTREHYIDRVYANYVIEVEVMVMTFHYPGIT
jgi:hypothetical protein